MPPVLCFSGLSGSGKTTLLCGVVRILSDQGFRLGLVKHHGHPETAEPKKDTDLYLEAGALAVALTGPDRAAVFRPQKGDPGPLAAAAGFPAPVDLVLAEGFKTWAGFKVEVVAPGQTPVLTKDPLLLAVAATGASGPGRLDRDDPRGVAEFVRACFLPSGRKVPDKEACFGLMARHDMRPNILVHSLAVAEASGRIAAALVRAGRLLDLPLVLAGALLHDIAKTECLGRKCPHGERGFDILIRLGYPEVAQVVLDHIDPEQALRRGGPNTASAVVNYADKRVLHHRVIGLSERISDLIERYGATPEGVQRLRRIGEQSQTLEAAIFDGLDMTPDDLLEVNHLFNYLE